MTDEPERDLAVLQLADHRVQEVGEISGRPLDPGMVTWTLRKALKAAGLPRVRVHDLRHAAATLLLSQGVHPKVVQELLGHSSITLTLDTYSHVMPGLHAEAAARMDALFEGPDELQGGQLQ